jgi:hypothetical protein
MEMRAEYHPLSLRQAFFWLQDDASSHPLKSGSGWRSCAMGLLAVDAVQAMCRQNSAVTAGLPSANARTARLCTGLCLKLHSREYFSDIPLIIMG